MKRGSVSFVGALVLLFIAFLPPVVVAAEHSENVHFLEHVLILLAGLLVARGVLSLRGYNLTVDPGRAQQCILASGLGLLVFLASMFPAFDALADASLPIHMLQHGLIFISGVLIGTGLLLLVFGRVDRKYPSAGPTA